MSIKLVAGALTQIVGILDSYAYRAMVWDVFVERMRRVEPETSTTETKADR